MSRPQAHLVYPHSPTVIRTPFAVGLHLGYAMESAGYRVVLHDWQAAGVAVPSGPDDILIGHPHPDPNTCFRRSLNSGAWKQKIIVTPFNNYPKHMHILMGLLEQCDKYIAICGDYWAERKHHAGFGILESGFFPIDLAVDTNHFPRIKERFSPPGKRKFLYIGNADECKNTKIVASLAKKHSTKHFGSIGASISNTEQHGYLNFEDQSSIEILKSYDFLLVPSHHDANPTVVLEAMAWGLIPICSKTCGYLETDGPLIVETNNLRTWDGITSSMQLKEQRYLELLREKNWRILQQKFQWERFRRDVVEAVLSGQSLKASELKYEMKIRFARLKNWTGIDRISDFAQRKFT